MLFYYFEKDSDYYEAWRFLKTQRESFVIYPPKIISINNENFNNYIPCTSIHKGSLPAEVIAKLPTNIQMRLLA